jgi:type IV secretory pathway VirD2 relaxase
LGRVDHHNTGHPHTHIIVRGKDDLGKDLVIARDYMTAGVRERATEIVSFDLGPRTDKEIDTRLQAEVAQDRFTSLDKTLLNQCDENGLVRAVGSDPFRQSLMAGRLNKLEDMNLAEKWAQAVIAAKVPKFEDLPSKKHWRKSADHLIPDINARANELRGPLPPKP